MQLKKQAQSMCTGRKKRSESGRVCGYLHVMPDRRKALALRLEDRNARRLEAALGHADAGVADPALLLRGAPGVAQLCQCQSTGSLTTMDAAMQVRRAPASDTSLILH